MVEKKIIGKNPLKNISIEESLDYITPFGASHNHIWSDDQIHRDYVLTKEFLEEISNYSEFLNYLENESLPIESFDGNVESEEGNWTYYDCSEKQTVNVKILKLKFFKDEGKIQIII